jgi:hypothetical protein
VGPRNAASPVDWFKSSIAHQRFPLCIRDFETGLTPRAIRALPDPARIEYCEFPFLPNPGSYASRSEENQSSSADHMEIPRASRSLFNLLAISLSLDAYDRNNEQRKPADLSQGASKMFLVTTESQTKCLR